MVKTKTLQNGIRVIVKRMEGLLSVTMGILVGTGSSFETDEEDGISHFIEHMQFKGTATRTTFEISDGFDALGAQVNAFTGKDMTCYYSKATSDHAREAFELLSDLFLNSVFPEEEMKREKGVVLQEIKKDEESYDDYCLDLLARAAFGKRGYGRNILGPSENVKRFTREDIFAYKRARYCPQNIVISFAGNISSAEAFALAEEQFGSMACSAFEQRKKDVVLARDKLVAKRPIEQVHLALCFPTVNRDDPAYPAVQVMNAVLGGGMSSRLFKRVREELGLAYDVSSYTSHYEEIGMLTVYAGVEKEAAGDAAAAILEVIEGFRKKDLTEEEFSRGREQLRAGNIFSQESTSSQMLLYGRNLLYRREVYDFEKRMQEYAVLTRQDVLDAIDGCFDFQKIASACVGDVEKPLL